MPRSHLSPKTYAPLLLTVEEVAHLLRLSPRTIWSLAENRELEPAHIGRAARWRRSDVFRFADSLSTRASPRRAKRTESVVSSAI